MLLTWSIGSEIQQWWQAHSWIAYRLAAALLAGMLVGLEREFRDKPAGLRTMILISGGACIFSMVSQIMGGPTVDATRIAAQIVTGVGFLGAGSILRSSKTIYGLTTAASIWMVAAVGMACGFGRFDIALWGTVAILVVLILFQKLTHTIERVRFIKKYRIATRDPQVRFEAFSKLFEQAGLRILRRNCYRDGDRFVYTFRVQGSRDLQMQLREKLVHMEDLVLLR